MYNELGKAVILKTYLILDTATLRQLAWVDR
jgi:hypothetical protein